MDTIALLANNASVAYTGTAGNTAVFASTAALLIWTTSDAFVKVGDGVTATTSDLPIPAYTPIIMRTPSGVTGALRASAIQISAGGTLYAVPVSAAVI